MCDYAYAGYKCTHMYRNADPVHLLEALSVSININVKLAVLHIFVGVYFCNIESER